MWTFIIKLGQFIILAAASVGVSILISFVTKINFENIKPINTLADVNEIPYHVVIMDAYDPDDQKYKCSGTLIHEKHVISLASCVREFVDDEESMVVSIGTRTIPGGYSYNVEKVTLHPDYDHDSRKDDIALVTLKGKVYDTRKPISYSPQKRVEERLKLLVSGYGDVRLGYQSSLHRFNMTIIDAASCKKHFSQAKFRSVKKSLDMSKKFCAVADDGNENPKTSKGSPATIDQQYIIGIFQFKEKAKGVELFIDVSEYLDFIKKQIRSSTGRMNGAPNGPLPVTKNDKKGKSVEAE